jgi:AsmA protein
VLDSSLNFQDEGSGRAAFVHELNLETGRLADATAGEVNARFRLQSVQPPLDLQMRLAGQLRYDHATRRYQVSSMEGHAQGEAGDVSELALEWRGTLTSLPQEHKLVLEPFNAVARGRLAQDRFEGRLAAARVQLVQGQWQASGVSISASALRADATLAAELQAPGFEAGPQAWRSAQVQASVEFKRGEGTLQARLTTPVQYDAAARQLQLEAITGQGSATHPLLATRLDATLNGKLQAALDAQTVALEFKAAIDDSRFGGEVQLRDFRDPAWSFDLTSNILDVDRHLVSDWPGRLRERLQATDFEQLKALNLRGRLRSDELRMARLKASQLLAELRAGAGTLSVEPLGARLYGGSLDGGLSLVAGATPQLAVRHKLAGVQLDALLADLTGGEARLSGKGNISVDLQTQGATLDELRSGLRGTASLALARGTLAGLDLGEALVAAKEQIGLDNAVRSDSVRLTEHTPYTELRATLAFDAGQARSSDLLLRSPALALKGEGTFALDSGRLDAKLQASVAPGLRRASAGELAELAGISLPLQVSGPWATAVVRVEAGAASGGSAARLAKSNAARVVALAVPAAPPASAAAASAPASTTASAPVDTKTPSAPARPASGSRAAAR